MIPIVRLHYKIDQKLNKLASNQQQSISIEDKDLAINEAIIKLIKKKIGPNNLYGIGIDGFRKRYQDLEGLVVEHKKVTPTEGSGPINHYFYKTEDFDKFFLPIDVYAVCSKDNCPERIVWAEQIAPHGDVPMFLKSSHLCPSFAYQASFIVISSGKILFYTEDPNGKFKVDNLYVSYLRYPNKVCFGDYEDFDGQVLIQADSELPIHLEDEIIELAVLDLALSTQNEVAAQSAQIRAKDGE